jgi:hypothetical protein
VPSPVSPVLKTSPKHPHWVFNCRPSHSPTTHHDSQSLCTNHGGGGGCHVSPRTRVSLADVGGRAHADSPSILLHGLHSRVSVVCRWVSQCSSLSPEWHPSPHLAPQAAPSGTFSGTLARNCWHQAPAHVHELGNPPAFPHSQQALHVLNVSARPLRGPLRAGSLLSHTMHHTW